MYTASCAMMYMAPSLASDAVFITFYYYLCYVEDHSFVGGMLGIVREGKVAASAAYGVGLVEVSCVTVR